jgi:hypothetical protein
LKIPKNKVSSFFFFFLYLWTAGGSALPRILRNG